MRPTSDSTGNLGIVLDMDNDNIFPLAIYGEGVPAKRAGVRSKKAPTRRLPLSVLSCTHSVRELVPTDSRHPIAPFRLLPMTHPNSALHSERVKRIQA